MYIYYGRKSVMSKKMRKIQFYRQKRNLMHILILESNCFLQNNMLFLPLWLRERLISVILHN